MFDDSALETEAVPRGVGSAIECWAGTSSGVESTKTMCSCSPSTIALFSKRPTFVAVSIAEQIEGLGNCKSCSTGSFSSMSIVTYLSGSLCLSSIRKALRIQRRSPRSPIAASIESSNVGGIKAWEGSWLLSGLIAGSFPDLLGRAGMKPILLGTIALRSRLVHAGVLK